MVPQGVSLANGECWLTDPVRIRVRTNRTEAGHRYMANWIAESRYCFIETDIVAVDDPDRSW